MKLSQETIIGLKRLCNPSIINDENFHRMVIRCSELVRNERVKSRQLLFLVEVNDCKADVMKTASASLAILLVEAARQNVDSFVLKTVLEEYCSHNDRVTFIVESYEQNAPDVQQLLIRIGTNVPHIVDLNWSLDFSVQSDHDIALFQPYFHIEIISVTFMNTKKIVRFVCSVQNLQELIFVLKGACKHLKKITSIK